MSQRWQMAKSEEGAVEQYQGVLARELDQAAGLWAGEMGMWFMHVPDSASGFKH